MDEKTGNVGAFAETLTRRTPCRPGSLSLRLRPPRVDSHKLGAGRHVSDSDNAENKLQELGGTANEAVGSKVTGDKSAEHASEKLREAGEKLKEAGEKVAEEAGDKLKEAGEKLKEAGEKLKEAGEKVAEEAGDKLKEAGEKLKDVFTKK